MKFIDNIFDPYSVDAYFYHDFSPDAITPQQREEEWRAHLDWVATKHVGRPQATEHHTVASLEKMGMVGIYERDELPAQ